MGSWRSGPPRRKCSYPEATMLPGISGYMEKPNGRAPNRSTPRRVSLQPFRSFQPRSQRQGGPSLPYPNASPKEPISTIKWWVFRATGSWGDGYIAVDNQNSSIVMSVPRWETEASLGLSPRQSGPRGHVLKNPQ